MRLFDESNEMHHFTTDVCATADNTKSSAVVVFK